jgi:hypothetical protein
MRVALVVSALAAAAMLAGTARADGDPASDMLVIQNVFLPYELPSQSASAGLTKQVAAAYAAGYRLKVAVIGAPVDLGAIPSLFNKPQDYARFLGQELSTFYIGPLLIVMPKGYGIYDGGRSTSAETGVLGALAAPGSAKPDTLVNAATSAVSKLTAAGALHSKDILKPYVETLLAKFAGGRLTVQYYLYDDSGKAAVTITVMRGTTVAATVKGGLHTTSILRPETQRLSLPSGATRVCVAATDPSGNRAQSCKPVGR